MGFTDWKCASCGKLGHSKSKNPAKCAAGSDRFLDAFSGPMQCCACRVKGGASPDIACPQCRGEIPAGGGDSRTASAVSRTESDSRRDADEQRISMAEHALALRAVSLMDDCQEATDPTEKEEEAKESSPPKPAAPPPPKPAPMEAGSSYAQGAGGGGDDDDDLM